MKQPEKHQKGLSGKKEQCAAPQKQTQGSERERERTRSEGSAEQKGGDWQKHKRNQ